MVQSFRFQVFRKDKKNKVVFLADSLLGIGLGSHVGTTSEERRVFIFSFFFRFDFVYPVTNITRQHFFYDPILGPAEVEAFLPSGSTTCKAVTSFWMLLFLTAWQLF
jgi:hypothetical protein